jgi:hypothetical protein
MGYRSDVTVAIYPDNRKQEGYDMLKVLMGTTFKDVPFDDCMSWHDDKCALVYNIMDVKWYDSYADIKAFLSMLDVLANDVEEGGIEGYNYELVRLGEDADDIEQSQGGCDIEYCLSINREVSVDL